MEMNHAVADEERYVDNRYVRECLTVSRTNAYEIMTEIEEENPYAVFRYGRSKRVRKDVFDQWVADHCGGGPDPHVLGFVTQLSTWRSRRR